MKNPVSGSVRRVLTLTTVALVLAGAFALLRHSSPVKASTTLGSPIANLTSFETTLFTSGFTTFDKTWSLVGGLGPVFTQANCAVCHGSPVIGGGSSGNLRKDELFGTTNSDGSFNPLTSEGGPLLQQQSVSEFKSNCKLKGEVIPTSPPFPLPATIFDKRLAPQAFGMGLIDSIPDSAILAEAMSQQTNMPFGIAGQANIEPDENGINRPGRFGYKAEAVDLIQFVALALNNEVGITTPVFPTENLPQGGPIPTGCNIAVEPNDNGSQLISTYNYLLYLAPNPFPQNVNQTGENLFNSIGCSSCHLTSYTTGAKIAVQAAWPEGSRIIFSKALSNQTVMLYSDLLLHNMGALGDGFPFGQATGNQFRTTPLWGLSTRTTYLHDGRASTLANAIAWHDKGSGSEAHQVIQNYNALSSGDQTALLQFIGSL